MGLAHKDGRLMTAAELERSETIPKICIIGKPHAGGHVAVRYFTPQTAHNLMAVSGGCCLAAAPLIPGTVAHEVAQGVPALDSTYADFEVGIENQLAFWTRRSSRGWANQARRSAVPPIGVARKSCFAGTYRFTEHLMH
jgi:hypothetical protein